MPVYTHRWIPPLVLLAALSTSNAQQPVPVRPLGPIVARVRDTLGAIAGIRSLTDGRLLVNDVGRRRVVLFDSSLQHATIVADTTGGTAKAYGNAPRYPGALIPYLADTTLFFDQAALALLVIDPRGKIVRTIATPLPGETDAYWANGAPATDHQGRLVLRLNPPRQPPTNRPPGSAPQPPDSAPIVRVGLSSHTVDTVAFVAHHVLTMVQIPITAGSEGASRGRTLDEPFFLEDDWTVTADGSVAVVRGQDFHVDFVNEQGIVSRGPKMPFDWRRLGDTNKIAMADSMRLADSLAWTRMTPEQHRTFSTPQPVIDAAFIPDYHPAFASRTTRADAEGNVWIKTTAIPTTPGGPVYDVVNRQGTLIDRIQVPGGCTIIGFGPGVVYLSSRVGSTTDVVRARIR